MPLDANAPLDASLPRDTTVPRWLRQGLRSVALDLKARRARGHVSPVLWAGVPGEEARAAAFDTGVVPRRQTLDRSDHLEVALALAHVVRPLVRAPIFWVTRSGTPDLCDPDLSWLAATRGACDVLDLEHQFAVVTREGWHHEPSGTVHRWKRLRA
ncbi:hypothetical protein [Nocardioides jishulii]|uniref:Uncharacterized protein n=1 Tax=Nocardioides jishulii TaxID=2575440 RepID=A0A4U2YKN2_9ACTN|nr:hypothetical protein [Nocardioides jishulii]QCX27233.1 hypothetical protein FCL41_06630 [Nocardioides jishulii]TKI61719.1 hypothetical protein FC770_13270 [Nocardioides jishulii]